jgi:two-component system alkaline phosphatase synthesis response regulator PhoP
MPKCIFVCDDDQGIIDFTSIILEEKGYFVVACRNSEEIFHSIAQKKIPDLIFLDLWIPDLGGAEIVKRLKKIPEVQNTPVIIFSASKDTQKITSELNVAAFLQKPFDIDEMEGLVKKYLG